MNWNPVRTTLPHRARGVCMHCGERIVVTKSRTGNYWTHTSSQNAYCHPWSDNSTFMAKPKEANDEPTGS